MTKQIPPYILISKRFRAYDKTIRDIWEVYQFHRYYLPILHKLIKKEQVPVFTMPSLPNLEEKQKNLDDTLGVISHIGSQFSPQRGLVVAVSQSEVFLQYLMTRVLRDFPGRLAAGAQVEQGPRELKMLEVIVNSADKGEMLDKLIEERVRSLFYGQPSDFFLKDKSRLGFGDYFSNNCADAIERYSEIVARRNLLIHNDGRVDRKYLREVPGTPLKLGQKATVDQEYLRQALLTLRGLSATAGVLVCERVYNNVVPSGIMLSRFKRFNVLA
jgi:hypothetical protein